METCRNAHQELLRSLWVAASEGWPRHLSLSYSTCYFFISQTEGVLACNLSFFIIGSLYLAWKVHSEIIYSLDSWWIWDAERFSNLLRTTQPVGLEFKSFFFPRIFSITLIPFLFCILITTFLRYNLCTIRCILLECIIDLFLVYSQSCEYNLIPVIYLIPEHFHHPKKKPCNR